MNAIYTILQQNYIPVMPKKAFLQKNKKSNFFEEGIFFKKKTDLKVFFDNPNEKKKFDKEWDVYLKKNKDAVVKTKCGRLLSFSDNGNNTKNLESWYELEPNVFSYYNFDIPKRDNKNKIVFILLIFILFMLIFYYLKKISLL